MQEIEGGGGITESMSLHVTLKEDIEDKGIFSVHHI